MHDPPGGQRTEAGDQRRDDYLVRIWNAEELDPAEHERRGEGEAEEPVGHVDADLAADEDAWDRPEQEPADRGHVDVPGDEMAEARNPEERGHVEDVGPDRHRRTPDEHPEPEAEADR